MPVPDERLAQYLRVCRLARKRPRPSVRDIATEVGVPVSTVARWLKGEGIPGATPSTPKKKPPAKPRTKVHATAAPTEAPPPDDPPDTPADVNPWRRQRDRWLAAGETVESQLAALEASASEDPDTRVQIVRLRIAQQKAIVDAGLVPKGIGDDVDASSAAPRWLMNVAAGWMPDGSHPLKPHQVLILQASAKWLIVRGGRGTFKTTACIIRMLLHCWRYPGQILMVAASTYSQLRYVFQPLWEQIVPAELYRARWSANTIELPGCRSEIWLVHSEHNKAIERVRGASISGYFLIQSEMLRGDAGLAFLEQLDPGVRLFGDDPDDPRYLRITDPNGAGPDRPINRRFLDPASASYIGDRMPVESSPLPGVRLRRDGRLSVLTVETTPETSVYTAETIDGWRATWPEWQVEQQLHGEFVAAEGRVYETWTTLDTAPAPESVQEFWIGMDPGTVRDDGTGRGNLALVVMARLADNRWAFVDEWLGGYPGLAALLERVRGMVARWGEGKFQGVVRDWGGGPGTPFADYLRHHGGIDVWSPARQSAKWFRVAAGAVLLDTRFRAGTLVISPACVKLIRDLQQYVQDSDGEPDKSAYDPHLADAARYVGIRVLRQEE